MTCGVAASGANPDGLTGVHRSIERYYSGKIREYGATALGVDWNCVPAQELRFAQLVKVIDFSQPLALNDVGCGYGALLAYLGRRHRGAAIDYRGCDLSAEMIRAAKRKWRHRTNARFVVGANALEAADYALASGIFNVNREHGLGAWEHFVAATLTAMSGSTRKGFAVNFMAPSGPGETTTASPLYRVAPWRWMSFCDALGCTSQMIGGYGLQEYTLLVRHAVASVDGGR